MNFRVIQLLSEEAVMKTLRIFTAIAAVLTLVSSAFALPADKGDFVTLGREDRDGAISEKVVLYREPGDESVTAMLQSGTAVLVLDKRTAGGETFYIVSTVGRDGGIIGWITGEYICEILPGPPAE